MSHCCGSIRSLGASGAPGAGMPPGVTNQDILVWNGSIWVPEARVSGSANAAAVTLDAAPTRTVLATVNLTKQVFSPLLFMANVACRAVIQPDRAQFFITANAVDRHAMYLTTPFGASVLIADADEWFMTCAFEHRSVLPAGAYVITLEGMSVFAVANNIQVDSGRLIAFELIE